MSDGVGLALIGVILMLAVAYLLLKKPKNVVQAVEREKSPAPMMVEPPKFEGLDFDVVPEVPLAQESSGINEDEIDFVAEADVYLAYGRDYQAEEILKEGLVKNPNNDRAKLKLLEIYAGRMDKRSFDKVMEDLRVSTGGSGDVWDTAVELGRIFSPSLDLDLSSEEASEPEGMKEGVSAAVASPEALQMLSATLFDIRRSVDRGGLASITIEVGPDQKRTVMIRLK